MLSTIKVLSQIEQDFKKSKSLEGYLPSLISSLQSEKKIVFTNMNGKQKLSQLQSLIQGEIKKIDKTLVDLNVNLQEIEDQDNQIDEQQEQYEEEQDNEQFEQDLGQDIEDDMQNQEQQQGDENDMQMQEEGEEEQFIEPEFDNANNMEEQQQLQDKEQQQQVMAPKKKNKKRDDYDKFHDSEQDQGQQQEQEQIDSQEDIGLYGEQLNENDQDFQGYDNEFDQQEFKEFQKEFGDKQPKNKKDKIKKLKDQQESQNPDQYIQDNFDHFREIQLDNQKKQQQTQKNAPKTDLDNQIDRLEGKVIGKRDWVMKGQIKARQRPANSLLQYDLQFNSGIKYTHQITQEKNTELQELIKKRILNDMFDDRTRFVNTNHIRQHFGSLKEVSREKSQMGLGELYESQFKNFLGIGENKNEKLKAQIMDSFKELNYFLDSLSNFSFVPKPTKDNNKKGQQAIIVEEKVPLTLWNGQKQVQKDGKMRFESEKQVDNQAKRLKNKRIARQRKKQQMKKKLNKVIEYGGITKFEAQAKKKAQMNNKPLKIDGVNMKYNKSSSFFKNITENKGGKPNPDISKMKI